MRPRWLAVVPLCVAHWGCTVTAVSPRDDPRPSNTCTASSDCKGGDSCRDGLCQTLNGQLEGLLISATPPSDSLLPHLTFVTHLEDVPTSGGERDITLPGLAQVTGSLSLPKGETCYPDFAYTPPDDPILKALDGTLPVTVTLALRQRLLGLSQQIYYASTPPVPVKGGYPFDVKVPSGAYDVYLVPPKQQTGCVVPPQLYRNLLIGGDTMDKLKPTIEFRLSAISSLDLRIAWPVASESLVGWLADIIEPLGGNPISTEVVLSAPSTGKNSSVEYAVPLYYSTVNDASSTSLDSASDLLRLRPPAGLVAPTIFLDRSALGLLLKDPNGRVELRGFTRFPSAVEVHGQMARRDGGAPVGGFVTLVSTEIFGVDPGIFASYQTTVMVEADGAVSVALPPGKYRVQAVPEILAAAAPLKNPLSALETKWEVPADQSPQFGKVLELETIAKVTGQSGIQGAQVQAVPSPQTTLPFEDAFGVGPFAPRAAAGLVDPSGRFVVRADPGRFDISVQADEALGFAWFVRPGVEVAKGDEDLGRIKLPSPALLSGTARVTLAGANEPLKSSAIRAYAYLDKNLAYTRDPKVAVSVVQVAETRADVTGAFRLLIPSIITPPK